MLKPKGKNILVKVRNLDIVFGRGERANKAINDVSLNVYKGEVLGIVGESGSGKTTLGNAMIGLVSRVKGTIEIEDRLIPDKPSKIKGEINSYIVNKVQMVFQDPANALNPYKNIEKIVGEGLDNIDLKSAFIKSFDFETIIGLKKIFKKLKPDSLKKVSIDEVNKMVNEKKYDLIKKKIYVDIYNELIKKKATKNWSLAATYLEAKLGERNKFLSGNKKGVKAIKKKLIIEILQSVGLSERILSRYPLEFSGGQQQRIGISRAVVLRPKLLIADEPISALDVSIQAQVVNIFNDLKRKFNLTIVFIAHDLRMVEYISDRIAVMYKGVLVEIGPAKEISQNPIHPYTKSLLDAVPSIDGKKGSLVGYTYDSSMHGYELSKGRWVEVSPDRFVRGTENEIKKWLNGDWSFVEEGVKYENK